MAGPSSGAQLGCTIYELGYAGMTGMRTAAPIPGAQPCERAQPFRLRATRGAQWSPSTPVMRRPVRNTDPRIN